MNRRGIGRIKQIGIGITLGIVGLITATVGAMSGQVWTMRIGAIITTIGVWCIQWT